MPDLIIKFDLSSPSAPKAATTRPATPEERRYLRRFNLLRLMRYLGFLTPIIFVVVFCGLFLGFVGMIIVDGHMPEVGWLLLPFVLILVAVIYKSLRPVLPAFLLAPPMLRVPADLQVHCFSDKLQVISHATDTTENIFVTGAQQRLVELPDYWARQLAVDGDLPTAPLPLQIAHLPGASGRVLRLPMYTRYSRARIDPIFPDLGDFVLGAGQLSITNEMRAKLPVIRASDTFAVFSFGLGLLAFLVGLCCWVLQDMHKEDVQRVEHIIAGIESEYGADGKVPVAALATRGLTGLRPDAEFGDKVLHGPPASFHDVSLTYFDQPFYLTEVEIEAIGRIVTVAPENLSGSAPPSAELLGRYRTELSARADAVAHIMPELRQAVASLPDDLIAAQLRALWFFDEADPSFIKALLPQPMISAPVETSPYILRVRPACFPGDVLCGQRGQLLTYENPIYLMQGQTVTVHASTDLDRLAEARAELQALNAQHWQRYSVIAAAIVVVLCVICCIAGFLARRRIRGWYRRQAGG